MSGLRERFRQVVGIAIVVFFGASCLLFRSHDGFSWDLVGALALLVACLAYLLIDGRRETGRWFWWSRR